MWRVGKHINAHVAQLPGFAEEWFEQMGEDVDVLAADCSQNLRVDVQFFDDPLVAHQITLAIGRAVIIKE